MSGLRKTLIQVDSLRNTFEALLRKAGTGGAFATETIEGAAANEAAGRAAGDLREITGFGSNPGALRMLAHVPANRRKKIPLVIALHGCGQTAAQFSDGTGWSRLADELGFALVLPEQQAANNPKTCFSWFVPQDITRGSGEAHSIRQMIDKAQSVYDIDPARVFVTGLSAGGAMSAVMLATYPEVFSAGAVIAGLAYGSAGNVQEAFEAMFSDRAVVQDELAARVRAASDHLGPWPRISVWHGSADMVVKPGNADQIVRQWADLHGVSALPTVSDNLGGHARRVWKVADGTAVIEAISIAGMSHGVPVAASLGASAGAAGPYFIDVGVSSTRAIARFWGLGDVEHVVGVRAPVSPDPEVATGLEDTRDIVAAALKAGGLRPQQPAGGGATSDTGAIIEAALKAAGLMRK